MKPLSLAISLVIFSATSFAAKQMIVSPAERGAILKTARVWKQVNISGRDLLNGPGDKFKLFQKIENCHFYDSFYSKVGNSGKTQKFWCVPPGGDPAKDEVKIKYGNDNGEVFGEVVSSRLLWSLGFFADKALPISATCINCPKEPWKYLNYMSYYQGTGGSIRPSRSMGTTVNDSKEHAAQYLEREQKRRKQLDSESIQSTGARYTRSYDVALSEQKYKGTAITIPGDDKAGVGLDELEQISEEAGGSTRAQIDALRLLAAFIKHGDNKAANQRLVCPEEFVTEANGQQSCKHASIVLQDIGATMGDGAFTILDISFGPTANSKFSYDGWENVPVWKDRSRCQALLGDNLVGGTLNSPTVSEAGRKFLADLLVQLSDQQISDMFTAARVDKRVGVRSASVEQWVKLFKEKRNEIVTTRCPN